MGSLYVSVILSKSFQKGSDGGATSLKSIPQPDIIRVGATASSDGN